MWPDLREELLLEEAQILELVESYKPLLDRCLGIEEPDLFDLSALAAFLHSLYCAMENLFRRIALTLDGGVPTGDAWHQQLLRQMASGTESRSALLSEDLFEQLIPYLQFRHVFRNIYLFRLDWERMEPLASDVGPLVELLRSELSAFILEMEA